MTRRQWTGIAGVLFGLLMFGGIVISGSTPDNGKGAVKRYTDYWSDSGHQDRALIGAIVLGFAWVLLVVFAAGLRELLGAMGDAPHRAIALGAAVAAAAMFGVGGVLVNAPGIAAAQASGYEVDGNTAILLEASGYVVLTAAITMSAAMAVAFSLGNRIIRVVPGWTLVLTVLLALAALGSIATAWTGFMLLPLWAVVVGACLLLTRGAADEAAVAA